MQSKFSVLTIATALAVAGGWVLTAANSAQAQTVVHVRTADLTPSDSTNVKIEPVAYRHGYSHSYYRAPYRAYYGGAYRGYYGGAYRGYYGGAYRAWYGNPYYAYYPYYYPYYPYYYGPTYYAPRYYGYPYSTYYRAAPRVGVYVGPRGGVGVATRRGSFYW
jgi:hypothetical protein